MFTTLGNAMTWAFSVSVTKHPLLKGCFLTTLCVRGLKTLCCGDQYLCVRLLHWSNKWKIKSKGKDKAALLSLHSEYTKLPKYYAHDNHDNMSGPFLVFVFFFNQKTAA